MSNSNSINPDSKTGFKWLRSDVDKLEGTKLDKDVFETEMRTIKRDLRDRKKSSETIRKLAEDAMKKEYKCTQEKTMEHMHDNIGKIWRVLDGWKTMRIGVVVSVVALIAAAVLNYATLSTSVESNTKAVTEIKTDQKEMRQEISKDVDSIKAQISQTKIEQKIELQKRDEKRDKKLKQIMKEAVYEIKQDVRPSRRTRRTQ